MVREIKLNSVPFVYHCPNVAKISFFGMGQNHKMLGVCFLIKGADKDWVKGWIGSSVSDPYSFDFDPDQAIFI
jgi:hypothetical protein